MYVRSMSNWTEWVQWTRERSPSVPLCPQGPATNTFYTFVNRHAANILLDFGYETKHEELLKVKQWFSEVIASLFRFLYLTVSLKLAF